MCCKPIGHAFFGLVVGLMMVGLLFVILVVMVLLTLVVVGLMVLILVGDIKVLRLVGLYSIAGFIKWMGLLDLGLLVLIHVLDVNIFIHLIFILRLMYVMDLVLIVLKVLSMR